MGWNPSPLLNSRTRFGTVSLIAGVAVWSTLFFTERHHESKEAEHLLGLKEEAAQLFQASLNTRAAFFSGALNSDPERLHANQQAFSIALSCVKSADAIELFRRSIWPVLTDSQDMKALLESNAFLHRWSISETMRSGDRDTLSTKLVERIYAENEHDKLNALSTVLSEIAKGLNPTTADKLSQRILQRISHDHDGRSRESLMASLVALDQSVERSSQLIDILLTERDPYGLQILSRNAPDFEKNLDPVKAGELAQKLTARLANDLNPLAVDALVALLKPLSEKVSAREAADVASALVERAYAEWNPATVQTLMSGLNVFAKNLDTASVNNLAVRLAARLDLEPSPASLAIFASGFAGLTDKTGEKLIESTATHIAVRIVNEQDIANLESLAEVLFALKTKAGDHNIALATTTIAQRLIREQDLNAMVTLSSAVEKLDGAVPQQESETLATQMVARVSTERNHSAILPLTMAIDALDENIRAPKAEELASKLLARMRSDRDPEALRALAVGMRFFKDKVSANKFDEAASLLVTAMKLPQADLRTLAFGLHSCVEKAASAPFTQAAVILIAHLAADPQPIVESLNGIQSRVPSEQMDQAAAILVDLITQQTDAEKIRSLSANLASIHDRVSTSAANSLSAHLIARIATEHSPDLLRAFGNTLANLPSDSLHFANISQVFQVPQAPCQVALHVSQPERLSAIATELLNPYCSEDSWTSLAASLGEMTHQPIVNGTAKRPAVELDFDGMGALKDDDDDEGKLKSYDAEPLSVNFNVLSRVLDGIRPKDTFWTWQNGIALLSAAFILTGLICLVLGRANPNKFIRRSRFS